MKFRFIAVLLLCGGLGASAWAQCGGGIPSAGNPGCIPPDRSNSPYYNGGRDTPPPPAVWADRFGAVAYNAKTGEWGSSENEQSRARAEQVAMADCKSRTTEGCEIFLTYRNQCAAFAGTDGGVGGGRAPKVDEAIAFAIASCSKRGPGCQAIYSACSMPVRVQ